MAARQIKCTNHVGLHLEQGNCIGIIRLCARCGKPNGDTLEDATEHEIFEHS